MLLRNFIRSASAGFSSRISEAPRIAASGLFISCVSVCTYCSTYCLPSSFLRMVSSALPSSPISFLPKSGNTARSPMATALAYFPRRSSDRVNQKVTIRPIRKDAAMRTEPCLRIFFWLLSIKGWILAFGLATDNTPSNLSPSIIGAATYITVLRSSLGSVRVERAPYFPCNVR